MVKNFDDRPNRLAAIRVARGYTQDALGEALGVKYSAVSKYERGDLQMTLTQLRLAAKFLKCRVSDITGETEFDARAPAAKPALSREAIRRELTEIDLESIRWIRTWICRQPDPPNGLAILESRADDLRRQLEDYNSLFEAGA